MNTTEVKTEKQICFPNLFAALKAEHEKHLKEFIESIKDKNDLKELKGWYYSDLIPNGKNIKHFTVDELKEYLIKRKEKATLKRIDKDLLRLQTIGNSGDFLGAKVSIEWKNSRTWGMNPKGSASIETSNGWHRYEGESVSGCGYDKLSTSVASCLNQSNELLKAMYQIKENNPTAKNQEVFGYGAGYGLTPYFEGGVGVSCYPAIFEKLGFKFNTVASGKTFDVFTIEKA